MVAVSSFFSSTKHTGITFLRKEVLVWFPGGQGSDGMPYRSILSHFEPCPKGIWQNYALQGCQIRHNSTNQTLFNQALINEWDHLPENVVAADSVESFKCKMYKRTEDYTYVNNNNQYIW